MYIVKIVIHTLEQISQDEIETHTYFSVLHGK